MIPERYAPTTYALFRIVFGFLFFCFGLQKMFGFFGGPQAALMSLQGAAGVVETVCGLLILAGLLLLALPMSGAGAQSSTTVPKTPTGSTDFTATPPLPPPPGGGSGVPLSLIHI